jgi:hypothetical protein
MGVVKKIRASIMQNGFSVAARGTIDKKILRTAVCMVAFEIMNSRSDKFCGRAAHFGKNWPENSLPAKELVNVVVIGKLREFFSVFRVRAKRGKLMRRERVRNLRENTS